MRAYFFKHVHHSSSVRGGGHPQAFDRTRTEPEGTDGVALEEELLEVGTLLDEVQYDTLCRGAHEHAAEHGARAVLEGEGKDGVGVGKGDEGGAAVARWLDVVGLHEV